MEDTLRSFWEFVGGEPRLARSLAELAAEALALEIYYGRRFDAFALASKRDLVERESATARGFAIGIGDSDGDVGFLRLERVLGVFVGKACSSDLGSARRSVCAGLEGTRRLLECVRDEVVAGRTNAGALESINRLLEEPAALPATVEPAAPFAPTIFADKDGCVAPDYGKPVPPDMAAVLIDVAVRGEGVAVISSNAAEELREFLVTPLLQAGFDPTAHADKLVVYGTNGLDTLWFENGAERASADRSRRVSPDAETLTALTLVFSFAHCLRELGVIDDVDALRLDGPCSTPAAVRSAFEATVARAGVGGRTYVRDWQGLLVTLEIDDDVLEEAVERDLAASVLRKAVGLLEGFAAVSA